MSIASHEQLVVARRPISRLEIARRREVAEADAVRRRARRQRRAQMREAQRVKRAKRRGEVMSLAAREIERDIVCPNRKAHPRGADGRRVRGTFGVCDTSSEPVCSVCGCVLPGMMPFYGQAWQPGSFMEEPGRCKYVAPRRALRQHVDVPTGLGNVYLRHAHLSGLVSELVSAGVADSPDQLTDEMIRGSLRTIGLGRNHTAKAALLMVALGGRARTSLPAILKKALKSRIVQIMLKWMELQQDGTLPAGNLPQKYIAWRGFECVCLHRERMAQFGSHFHRPVQSDPERVDRQYARVAHELGWTRVVESIGVVPWGAPASDHTP